MIKNDAFQILSTFDKTELKEFKSYLSSQYSSQKLSVRIFRYFQNKYISVKENESLFEMSFAYKKICKKEIDPNGKKVFLNALSILKKDLINFLVQKKLEEESFEKDQLLIQIFHDRNLTKQAMQRIRKRESKLESKSAKDVWYYLKKMQLKHWAYFNNYNQKISEKNDQLQDVISYSHEFYISTQLLYACEVHLRTAMLLEKNIEIPLLSEILEISKSEQNKNILQRLYTLGLNFIQNQTEQTCDEYLQFILETAPFLTKEDQLVGFTIINNFMVQQLIGGNNKYEEEIFKLYSKGLELKIYIYQGTMNDIQFNNIINAACRLSKFEWAKQFILDYQEYLIEKVRTDLVCLCQADILFRERKFDDVIRQLSMVQFHNIYFALRSKGLLLRAYYLQNEDHYLVSDFCNSFSAFLNNEKFFNANSLKSYLVLIKYIRIFIREKHRLKKSDIIQQISEEENLLFKKWLLEQASKLKN